MSRSRYGRKKRLMSEINVVPYVDVMLVLLIIFMVTAPLLSQGVKVELPQNENQETFVVTVDASGNYYLNDDSEKIASAEEIERAVLRRNPGIPVMVRGDANAVLSHVMRATVLLLDAGVESVILVTESPES